MTTSIAEDAIKRFVAGWYRALDIHASVEECAQFLADSGLEMTFPEKRIHSIADFNAWYAGGPYSDGKYTDGVINIFFDETHIIRNIAVRISEEEAVVDVVVGWQASSWERPEARSKRISLDATQRWTVRQSSKNAHGLEIVTYIAAVEPFKYAPDSTRL